MFKMIAHFLVFMFAMPVIASEGFKIRTRVIESEKHHTSPVYLIINNKKVPGKFTHESRGLTETQLGSEYLNANGSKTSITASYGWEEQQKCNFKFKVQLWDGNEWKDIATYSAPMDKSTRYLPIGMSCQGKKGQICSDNQEIQGVLNKKEMEKRAKEYEEYKKQIDEKRKREEKLAIAALDRNQPEEIKREAGDSESSTLEDVLIKSRESTLEEIEQINNPPYGKDEYDDIGETLDNIISVVIEQNQLDPQLIIDPSVVTGSGDMGGGPKIESEESTDRPTTYPWIIPIVKQRSTLTDGREPMLIIDEFPDKEGVASTPNPIIQDPIIDKEIDKDKVCYELIKYRDGPLLREWERARENFSDKKTTIFEQRANDIQQQKRALLEEMDWATSNWSVIQAQAAGTLKFVADTVLQATSYAGRSAKLIKSIYTSISSIAGGSNYEDAAYLFLLDFAPVTSEVTYALTKAETIMMMAEAEANRDQLKKEVQEQLDRLDQYYEEALASIKKYKNDFYKLQARKNEIDRKCNI